MKILSHEQHRQRRLILKAGAATAAFSSVQSMGSTVSSQWERASPESAGIAPDLPERLAQGVKSGALANLHGVTIVRRGKLVLESYFTGQDERWGTPLGTVAFNADTLHDVRSVSKSVVSLLYGIALEEKKVPSVNTPLLEAFPAYSDLAQDDRRRQIQIHHALSMTMGLEWNEDLPYSDPRNSEIAMERSADRYRYVLERPILTPPGEKWRYNGGTTALLGHLISKGTGKPLLQFAREKLFTPLGIDKVEWTLGLNGEAAAASGLRMRPTDLAKIGQLLLQRGEWNGRTVVPGKWLADSLTSHVESYEGLQYGYQWFLAKRRDGSPSYMGIGYGGQRLVVVPALELAYVIFMGNYRRADQLNMVFAVQTLIHESLK
jgi:CubicO group peptidase (beta-lactamase class C family)